MSKELIIAALANAVNSPKQGKAYFARPRGSYITWLRSQGPDEGAAAVQMLRGLALDGVFVDVTDEARAMGVSFGACRYFRSPITGEGGREACALLSELTPDELAQVRVKPGHHGGPELVAETLPLRDTDILHIIVGNAGNPHEPPTPETATIFTWYPGRLTPSVKLSDATVKLG